MKILILANKMPYPPKDGGTIATFSLANALQKNGAEVDVLAMNTSKHYFDCENIPSEIREKIRFFSVEIDTQIKPLDLLQNFLFSSLPYNAQRFISEKFNRKLISLLQSTTYNIVQLEGLYLCPYIKTIRNYSKAKIALRSHNIESEIWKRLAKKESNILKKIYIKNLSKRIDKFEKSFFECYDFLLPITEKDANNFIEMGAKMPVHITPTGIELDSPLFFINNQNIDYQTLFYIGALDWQPNQEGLRWFIKNVWLKFKIKHPEAVFTIAGRNAPKNMVHFFKNNQVHYIGEIDNAIDLYAQQAIQIVPLFSGSGMRIKILEGMAAGKAIISTTIGTEGIDSEHKKNIFIADNAEDFLTCLSNLYFHKDICLQISHNARNFVKKNFDNSVIANSLLTFYAQHLS